MKAIGRKAAACAAALGLTTTGGTAWAAVRALSHDDALAKLDATCTAATTKADSLNTAFADLEVGQQPARWRAFLDQAGRIESSFGASVAKIKSTDAADNAALASIKSTSAATSKTLRSLRAAVGSASFGEKLDAATTQYDARAAGVQVLLDAAGLTCNYYDADSDDDAATADVASTTTTVPAPPTTLPTALPTTTLPPATPTTTPLPATPTTTPTPVTTAPPAANGVFDNVDPSYFPAIPQWSYVHIDLSDVGSTDLLKELFTGVAARGIVIAPSTRTSAVVMAYVPSARLQPVFGVMADEMAAEQKLAAEPEQAGYRVWCGTANQMGSCMAQRSDVLYQFVGPSPEALRPIISTLLAATPRR